MRGSPGLLLPALALTLGTIVVPPPASASDAPAARPFAISGTPFTGVIPAGFAAHPTRGGTLLLEGTEGDVRQASVELQVTPKATAPPTIDALAGMIQAYMATHAGARVDAPRRSSAGRAEARVITGSYRVSAADGEANLRQMTIVLEYPDYFVVFNYYNRAEYFDRHLPLVKQIVEGFEYRGR